ncbi:MULTISPECIES: DUF2249 domain-containing protein [unclassified Streptomyces]|uniref:DUF2249 domain-containing protein n=1 Tax=unclassified Streptomyces TaxID=2593676 RepID=UPI000DAB45CF|nr:MULTISPECIES: DUF2249 domain-containing protein [unclassified Streptomyces]PZT76349.1 hypothetical protein DNK56_23685 [Streptomyces sp. AC1-42W]PZT79697.1 hypothetical protein DNK55_09000 [Streptomyces sp. AC1-42T]
MSPAAEVFIQATGTDPDVQAQGVVEHAQGQLLERLEAVDASQAESAAPLVEQLRRYLEAADLSLYAAASGAAGTRLTVRALRAQVAVVQGQLDALASAGDGTGRERALRTLGGGLAVLLGAERDVLLPALRTLPGVDLPALAEDFTTVLEGGRPADSAVVDVREIPHGRRHPRIFTRFARLADGESFVLVNNHDPKPLRREFEATHPDAFTWEYVESGPEQWQVRITRVAASA